jgi:hypothetical protein
MNITEADGLTDGLRDHVGEEGQVVLRHQVVLIGPRSSQRAHCSPDAECFAPPAFHRWRDHDAFIGASKDQGHPDIDVGGEHDQKV